MRENRDGLIFAVAAEGFVPQKVALPPPPRAPKTGITSEERRPNADHCTQAAASR